MSDTDRLPPRRPIHPRLIGPGAVLLIAALVTDLAYAHSMAFQWKDFSSWLLTAGLVLAGLGALAVLLDARLGRIRGVNWLRFIALAIAALLSLVNAFVHSRDAYTGVVPEGLVISAIVTLILLVVGWRDWGVVASVRPLDLKAQRR